MKARVTYVASWPVKSRLMQQIQNKTTNKQNNLMESRRAKIKNNNSRCPNDAGKLKSGILTLLCEIAMAAQLAIAC